MLLPEYSSNCMYRCSKEREAASCKMPKRETDKLKSSEKSDKNYVQAKGVVDGLDT